MAIAAIFGKVSSSMSSFASRHRKKLTQEDYESLKSKAQSFKISEKVCLLNTKVLSPLKCKDSVRSLRSWREALETYAALADDVSWEDTPPEMRASLKKVCIHLIENTEKEYFDNPQKEKYRKSIRILASFITQKINDSSPPQVTDFIMGKVSRAELLEETKSRLHLLDLLSPSNNEEAKEQRESRKYLEAALSS